MIIRELNHIGLFTHDVDESIKFYRDILGGVLIRDARSLDGKSRFVYAQIGAGVIELIGVAPTMKAGFAHIAYLTGADGLDAAYESLSAQGYEFTVAPKAAASGDGRLAFFKDKSGVTFELIQREENIRLDPFATPVVASFDGVIINAPAEKLNEIETFYTSEFGLEKRADALGGQRFGIKHDNIIIRTGSPAGVDCIAMTAASGAQAALQAAGVKVEPAEGGAFAAYGPSGERFILV